MLITLISYSVHLKNNSVTIFTYGFGRAITRRGQVILKEIAAMNGGEFSQVEDKSAEKLKSAFGSYYQYFISARG